MGEREGSDMANSSGPSSRKEGAAIFKDGVSVGQAAQGRVGQVLRI